MMRGEAGKLVLIFLASLLVMIVGLNHQEIIGFDSRFYLFALEMWRHGPTWFPTTYGQPYPDYPVTSTFLIYLSAHLFGELDKFTAVLPSAVAASLTVVMTYQIGALRNKQYGLCAAFFLFLTMMFFKSARGIALDMYPTLVTATCFYIIDSAALLNKPKRVWWIYPLLAMGFAFRGPIGLIIPQSVISMYYLFSKEMKKFFITGVLAVCVLMLCTAILMAVAYQAGGGAFVGRVIHMEVGSRIYNAYQPFYFYFTTGISDYALTFPLAILGVFGLVGYRKESANIAYLIKLTAWMLIILIGMSIPGDKKIRYILPAAPAFCLLAAFFFMSPRGRYLKFLQNITVFILLVLPFLLGVLLGYISYYQKQQGLDFGISIFNIFSLLTILQAINMVVFAVLYHQNHHRNLTIAGIAALSFVLFTIGVLEPIEIFIDQARQFVTQIETQRTQAKAALVFYKQRPDAMPIKYLANMNTEVMSIFIDNEEQLLSLRHAFIIAKQDDVAQLPLALQKKMKVIASGKMGHVSVVVFRVD